MNRKPKAKSLGWWRNKCDALMQELGRAKNPRSILSGQPTQVMHHLVPKSVSSRLRYEWDNLIPLTNAEHMRLHQSGDPEYEFRIILLKGGNEWFEKLRRIGLEIISVNISHYRAVYKGLAVEADKLGITHLAIDW